MEAHIAQLQALLARYFDPAGSAESKEELEGLLTQFKFRPDAWRLGVAVLQRASQGAPQGEQSPYLLWFAASLLDDAVRRGWGHIEERDRAGLRAGLLHFLLHHTTALPAFVANKLAMVCANIARLDWPQRQPQFLHDLEGSLQQRHTRPGALLVLSVAMEQMEAVFPDQPTRDVGQVLWARGQELQERLAPMYPGVLGALCGALRDELRPGADADGAPQALATLEALKRILSGTKGNHGPALQVAASGPCTEELLATLAHIATVPQGVAGADRGEAVQALECLALVAGAGVPPAAAGALIHLLLTHLQAICAAAVAVGADSMSEEWWLGAVRLAATFLKRHLSGVDRHPELRQTLDALLQTLASLTFASRTARHVAVSCEVWRSISDVLSEQQDALWEAADPDAAQASWSQHVAPLREGLLSIVDTMLEGMKYAAPSAPGRAPAAAELDTSRGSGAELEDAVEAASVGAAASAEDADVEYNDEEELLAGDSPSEAEAYVNQGEAFVGQLIGIFPGEMVPKVLSWYASCLAALQGGGASLTGQTMCAALRDLVTCLKLMSRCSCHLPREGPHAAAASQAVYQTLQFATGWAEMRPGAAQLCGRTNEIDAAGTLAFKVLAALAAVWLPGQPAEAATQVADGCLQAAVAAVNAATSGAPPPPPLLLTSAFEMLAVLTSVLVSLPGPASGWLSEEKLAPLLAAAPGLLLGRLAAPRGGGSRAGQALYSALCDSLLRSGGGPGGAPAADVVRRRGAAMLQPLTDVIVGAVDGGTPAEVIEQVAPVLGAVVGRLKTTSKATRGAIFEGCIVSTVHASITLLRRCQEVMVSGSGSGAGGGGGASPAERMAQALNRLMAAVVDAFGAEIGNNGLESLLKTSLEIHSMEGTGGTDSWALLHSGRHSDALLALLAQCASTRGCPALLVGATLGFFFGLWEQAVEGGDGDEDGARLRGRSLKDLSVDRGALGAALLCKTCSVLEANWRRFVGRAPGGSSGAVAAAAAAMAARAGQAGASAYGAQAEAFASAREEEAAGQVVGPDAPLRMLSMAADFFDHAASQCQVAPAPGDVRLVLEALLDLEDAVQVSAAAELLPSFPKLAESLMQLLHGSGRLGALQDDIIAVLFLLAAADWKAFSAFAHGYVEQLNEVQYGGEAQAERRATLLQPFDAMLAAGGGEGPDGLTFSKGVQRFLNDAKHFEGQSRII